MCNHKKAFYYIKLTELYFEKNKIKKAYKCIIKADKLYPSPISKREYKLYIVILFNRRTII